MYIWLALTNQNAGNSSQLANSNAASTLVYQCTICGTKLAEEKFREMVEHILSHDGKTKNYAKLTSLNLDKIYTLFSIFSY